MKRRTSNKLYPAIIMLLISAVLVGSSTFAWFTMSRDVQATGIKLTAVAPTNLLISPDGEDGTWDEVITIDEAYNGKLIPASSLDGINMFKTDSTKYKFAGAPDDTTVFETVATSGENLGIVGTDAETAKNGYYVDYSLFIKTTGTEDVDVKLSDLLTTITETANDALIPAYRMAILTSAGANLGEQDGNLYNLGGGTYFGAKTSTSGDGLTTAALTGPIVEAGTGGTTATSDLGEGKIYLGAKTAAEAAAWIVYDDTTPANNTIFTVPGNTTPDGTNNIQIIVRIWIEGQDSACINANADGDEASITVGFSAVD